jgi:HEAT repeat protein
MRSLRLLALVILLPALAKAAPEGKTVPPEILKALEDRDPATRVKAIKGLSKLGVEAVPPLVKSLKDEEASVQQAAAYALRLLRAEPDALVAALKEHAADASPGVRKGVLGALGRCGPPALPTLLAGLKDSDAGVRTQVIQSFQPLVLKTPTAVKEVLPALQKALGDESPVVRLEVVRLLPRCGKEAGPVLLQAAQDADAKVRAYALAGLIPLKPDAKLAVPVLAKRLKEDTDLTVKQSALRTLGAIGGAEAVEPISMALTDREPVMQKAAVMALSKLGKEAEPALPALREVAEKADNAGVRTAAIEVLGGLGEKGEAAIVTLLKKTDSDTRKACLQHFGRKGKAPKELVGDVAKALTDEEGDVRALAAHVLGLIGPDAREALPALEKASKDDSEPAVRMLAEKAVRAVRK